MHHPIHALCIAPLLRSLRHLDAIIGRAEALLEADPAIAPETLINARLYPNMAPLVFQIRVATDTAKGAAARLSGRSVPSWPDDETTFAEIHERIGKAIAYLSSFEPADFDGADAKTIELKLGAEAVVFSGTDYVANFVLPNFYFHMVTAYDILRHNGVAIGKRDYLGAR